MVQVRLRGVWGRRTLSVVVPAVLLIACSGGATGPGVVFRTDGRPPSFALPSSGSGRCSMDYGAQVSLVDPSSGSQRWTTDVPWVPGAVAVIDGERLYTDAGGKDGSVVAMRLSDGRPLWQRPMTSVYGTPELDVVSGLLIIKESFSPDNSAVVALSLDDGTERWRENLSGLSIDPVQVSGDTVFVGDGQGRIFAFDASTGSQRWVAAFGADNTSVTVTLADDTLFARGNQSGLAAFDPASGQRRWAKEDGQSYVVIGTAGEMLLTQLFPPGGLPATLVAFRVENGDQSWERPLPGTPPQPAPSIATDQPILYGENQIEALDPATGQHRWDAPIQAGGARGNNTLLLVTSRPSESLTSHLVALDPTTGAIVWDHPVQAQQLSVPALVDDTIYLGAGRTSTGWADPNNGVLEAINAADGTTRWTTSLRDAVLAQPQPSDAGLVVASADAPLFCD